MLAVSQCKKCFIYCSCEIRPMPFLQLVAVGLMLQCSEVTSELGQKLVNIRNYIPQIVMLPLRLGFLKLQIYSKPNHPVSPKNNLMSLSLENVCV